MSVSQFDLTEKLSSAMDRQMVLPILTFLEEKKIVPLKSIVQAKIDIVEKTKMVDYLNELHKQLHNKPYPKAEFKRRRVEAHTQLKQWKTDCAPLLELLESETFDELTKATGFSVASLSEHKITEEHVNNLYRYAKLKFDIGQWEESAELLYRFRQLSTDSERCYWALWGKLAAEILIGVNLDEDHLAVALEDFKALLEQVDARNQVSAVVQLEQRTWLIHWSLFIYFGLHKHQDLVKRFLEDKMLNVIQTNAPHLLRYLVASTVLSRSSTDRADLHRRTTREVVNVLVHEQDGTDPFIRFFNLLYREYDVEAACEALFTCKQVMENDYFLSKYAEDFEANARIMVFELVAKLYSSVDLNKLSSQLRLEGDLETAVLALVERSNVNSVRIDTANGLISMTSSKSTIYQQLLDKTRSRDAMNKTEGLLKQVLGDD